MSYDLITGTDGKKRCAWCGNDPLYVDYHDLEWGRPVKDDTILFEKLCLEGFQAGLSWLTILKKRPAFREAFEGFDIDCLLTFGDSDIERLLQNPGIIQHRGKIAAVINNAPKARAIQDEFGSLYHYVRQYAPDNHALPATLDDVPAKTDYSEKLARDLKRRGWAFTGPTTCYAFMQAMGLINDHLIGCEINSSGE